MTLEKTESIAPSPDTEYRLVRAHTYMSLLMFGYVGFLGLLIATRLQHPDMLGSIEWLSWGRLRHAHTQGVFFGWLGNIFLAFLYYAVPRLANRSVTSRGLGWLLFAIWNFGITLPGWVLVQLGHNQALEWGEFPLSIDVVAVVGLLLTCIQFVGPFLRTNLSGLYVSGWYILGGLVFTLLAYPVGNFVPEFAAGAQGATYSGLWIHDAIGLYVTPLALAIAYIVIPAATRKPIYSHFLSLVGFWLLFFVYPLNGTHHYVFSSIPMDAQKGAIVASVYLGVDVILVVGNLLLSLRGSSEVVGRDVPLRFVWLGVVLYLVVSLQGAAQALMPVNQFIHFTDWVVGHAHLALIGFASFVAIGGMLHVWQRLPGARYNVGAAELTFWLLVSATGLMVGSLTIAGLVQGQMWASEGPWIESVRASKVYWEIRTGSGILFLLGLVALVVTLTTGSKVQTLSTTSAENSAPQHGESTPPVGLVWIQSAMGVIALAGVGFFALSFLVLAVWPNVTLGDEIEKDRPTTELSLSANELRGRAIYIREGCANCHTQLIRSTLDDVRRFGVVSQAWESANDRPHLWGTRRIGADLAREYGRRSGDWQLAHLFNPRHIVPASTMPPYPWLFEGSAGKPRQEALDLVAYLETLGREAHVARRSGPAPLAGMDPEEEKKHGIFCDCAVPRTAGPPIQLSTRMEPSEQERFARRGQQVFTLHCSGCHGKTGEANGPATEVLLPTPRSLRTARFSDTYLSEVLWKGVRGSAMSSWNELPVNDLRSLASYIRMMSPSSTEAGMNAQEVSKARDLFQANCQNCHQGETQSRGMLLAQNTSLAPAATRFQLVQPTSARATQALENGVPGTAMVSWKKKLNVEERKLLIRYLRHLYQGE